MIGNTSFNTSSRFAVSFDKKPSAGAYEIELSSSNADSAYNQNVSLYFEIEPDVWSR